VQRSWLPGEIVLEEKEPLMFVPSEMLLEDYLPGAKHDTNVFCKFHCVYKARCHEAEDIPEAAQSPRRKV